MKPHPTLSKPSDAQLAELILDVVPGQMRLLRAKMRANAEGEFTVPQLRVMAHVYKGAATANELASLQGVSLPAISKLVDTLVTKHLLVREYKEGNRKQVFLSLSKKGEKRFLEIRKRTEIELAESYASLSSEQRGSICEGLKALKDFESQTFSNQKRGN